MDEYLLKLVSSLIHGIYHQNSLMIAVTPAPHESVRRALLSHFQESYNTTSRKSLSISYNYLSNSPHKHIWKSNPSVSNVNIRFHMFTFPFTDTLSAIYLSPSFQSYIIHLEEIFRAIEFVSNHNILHTS